MIKHPEDRYQRRLIREKKASTIPKPSKARRQIKQFLQDQETQNDLKEYARDRDVHVEGQH